MDQSFLANPFVAKSNCCFAVFFCSFCAPPPSGRTQRRNAQKGKPCAIARTAAVGRYRPQPTARPPQRKPAHRTGAPPPGLPAARARVARLGLTARPLCSFRRSDYCTSAAGRRGSRERCAALSVANRACARVPGRATSSSCRGRQDRRRRCETPRLPARWLALLCSPCSLAAALQRPVQPSCAALQSPQPSTTG